MRFSTGGVRDYTPNGCGGPDLPATIPEVRAFQAWYGMAGHTAVSTWENVNVWGSDFRNDGGDLDPGGGSDIPQIYLFAGHGSCQSPPGPNSPDFLIVCGSFGTPNTVNIGNSSRWGNGDGRLQFMMVNASCPMDLVSLANDWFPVFQGLHMATGHSGTASADALDSSSRGSQLGRADRRAAIPFIVALSAAKCGRRLDGCWNDRHPVWLLGRGDRCWSNAGRGDRPPREQRITDNRPKPVANWVAWKWRTA